MRVHWFQHVAFEGLGSIEPWMQAQGHELTCTRWYLDEAAPDPQAYDWLIVMGGPMGVHDEAEHPWLSTEKQALTAAIQTDKPVLGICLGAQLIADCLGARVAPNPHKEIGWFDVRLTHNAALSPIFADFNDIFEAFHWHGDRFDCPARAQRMAVSAGCDQQAFVYRGRVVGLQFHLETTAAAAAALIEHCGDELREAPGIQTAEEMLGPDERFVTLNRYMDRLLQRMAQLAAA